MPHAKLKPRVKPQLSLPHRRVGQHCRNPPHCPTGVTALAPLLSSHSSSELCPLPCLPALVPVAVHPAPTGADVPVVVVNRGNTCWGADTSSTALLSAPALHQLHPWGTGAQTYLGWWLHQPHSQVGWQRELGKGVFLMKAWEGRGWRMRQDGWGINGWINAMTARAERHSYRLEGYGSGVTAHSPETASICGNG